MSKRHVKAILLDDLSILQGIQEVQAKRDDGTATKTCRDLLREKLTEIRLKGDPHAVRSAEAPEPSVA